MILLILNEIFLSWQPGYQDFHTSPNAGRPIFSKHEIDRSMLTVGDVLGNGAFGVVRKATLSGNNEEKIVAVKCLKGRVKGSQLEAFNP